jgi:hypothetical protein
MGLSTPIAADRDRIPRIDEFGALWEKLNESLGPKPFTNY